jgi:HD superfamily phosphohydrolase
MRTTKRIRTVLYGDQRLSSAELEVLHTPAMQRLYGLRQLGLTDRVFIDASHSRIHHVVGVLHQVDKIVCAVISNLEQSKRDLQFKSLEGHTKTISAKSQARYVRRRKSVIRFIGLLHDLTHAPFGHTIEDEILLVKTKHDHPERQSEAFYRLLCQLVAWLALEAYGPEWSGFPDSLRPFLRPGYPPNPPSPATVGTVARTLITGITEPKAGRCLKLTPKYIAEMFADLAYAMTALLHLEVLHAKELKREIVPEATEYQFQELVRTALQGTQFASLNQEFVFEPHRDAFMLDIVGNTVCADLLDYARRDSHFAGLKLGYDAERIAENFTLVPFRTKATSGKKPKGLGAPETNGMAAEGLHNPFDGWCLRTAISLVSHKYRTDVPSELMNLLNVRFYLYERVIYHSTKCAAGSMLGAALQLMGWRELDPGNSPRFPKNLEFVGDDVFLYDIGAALEFLIGTLSQVPKESLIDAQIMEKTRGLESLHNGLIVHLLKLRDGKPAGPLFEELSAAKLLLDRLTSRRYFRPVFRASPGTKEPILQLDADDLADIFTDSNLRYRTEREIEDKAGLPKGTITIHCPKRNTAEKIANVLLTKPAEDGETDPVHPLNEISELDPKTFEKHRVAVKAVEDMYKSMWRLTVYAAPEHMERWKDISDAAGRAIFEAAGDFNENPCKDRADGSWPNDEHLVSELKRKTDAAYVPPGAESDLSEFGEDLGRTVDGLLGSGRLGPIAQGVYDREAGFTDEGRKRLEAALIVALNGAEDEAVNKSPMVNSRPRMDRVITTARVYIKRIGKEELESFRQTHTTIFNRLPPGSFETLLSELNTAANNAKQLDEKAPSHQGAKFRQFVELVDEMLRKLGQLTVVGPARGLFGDHGE